MKRFSIILLAIAVALVMALPAGADPPHKDKPDKPDGPGLPPGMTCVEHGYVQPEGYGGSGPFTLTVGKGELACVDVIAPAGDWAVYVAEAIDVRSAVIRVQDSVAPGDFCNPPQFEGPLSTEGSVTLEDIPAATVSACGTQYAELINGEAVFAQTGDSHPLSFFVMGSNGKKGNTFTIEVTPPS